MKLFRHWLQPGSPPRPRWDPPCRRHLGRGRHVPLSGLCEMGRRLQEGDQCRAELSVDRLRRRHQADQGQDRHFRSLDAPLPGKELETSGLIQFPMVMGGIVPVVNIEGIKPGELTIDGPTLARIFLGEIKTWNDPAIAKLNPRPSCRRRRSPSCIAPTAPARPTISRITWRRSARSGSRRWASTPRSNGRWGSPRATKASPTTWRRPRVRSATSNMPTPSRTS